MAGRRITAPVCRQNSPGDTFVDPGTLCRRRTPAPGSIGVLALAFARPTSVEVDLSPLKDGGGVLVIEERKLFATLKKEANAAGSMGKLADQTTRVMDAAGIIRRTVLGAGFRKIRVISYHNRRYVTIYGEPSRIRGLRGRWYAVENTKIIQAGIGEAGADLGKIRGAAVSFFLVDAADALEAVLSDDQGIKRDLPFTLGVDSAKGLAGVLLAESVEGVVVEAVLAGAIMVSCAPLLAGLGAAILVGVTLDQLVDTHETARAMRIWCDRRVEKARRLLAETGTIVSSLEEAWREFGKRPSSIKNSFTHAEWETLRLASPFR
jgi:hypothetical protein